VTESKVENTSCLTSTVLNTQTLAGAREH
jgi:hypothetical protein